MKIFLLIGAVIFSINLSFASFIEKGSPEKIAIETHQQRDSVMIERVAEMSVKEFETLRGKKMNFIERLIFKIEKRNFTNRLKKAEGSSGFNIWGFALGLLYGPIGLLVAYVVSKNKNFRSSAWMGFKIWLVVLLIFFIVLLAKAGGKFK